MNIERLVAMANDISRYFESDPDQAAGAAGVADHLKRFWEPGMRKQIARLPEPFLRVRRVWPTI